MNYSSNLSTLFWVYSSRAINNNAAIYARLTIDGKKTNFSLKRTVDIRLWDARAQRMKGHSLFSRDINGFLIEVKSNITKAFDELRGENKIITGKLVRNRYQGLDKKYYTLRDIIEFHSTTMAHKLSPKTLVHYRTSQTYLFKYVESVYNVENLNLSELDYAFILGFESFLKKVKSKHYKIHIGNNTVMKHIQRIRKIITLAYHMEWIDKDPFIKFKSKMVKTQRDFLSKLELKKVQDLEISIDRLVAVRDIFLFSCYTGICYSDIMDLKTTNIRIGIDNKKWIMANRNKTGVPFKIPLLPIAENLIFKYKNHPKSEFSNKLFPSYSNQKLNSYLKEIADLSYIDKNLTFHMARHTFATTVTLSNGVPIETVSKLLGHTKMATTQIYARVIEEKISEDIQILQKKLAVQDY